MKWQNRPDGVKGIPGGWMQQAQEDGEFVLRQALKLLTSDALSR